MPGPETAMSPRYLFALVSLPLWITVAVTGCRRTPVGDCLDCFPHAPRSEVELIGQLKKAYQTRDYDTFRRVFHPDYQFYLNAPQPDGTDHWGLAEELRIHRRIFNPQDVTPPEPPVPQDLWSVSIDIQLNPRNEWHDAPGYYFDPITNPGGLQRERYSVTQADYVTDMFFQTQGETQYRVDGTANFVVVNDLSKALGADGKFLIYRWHDLTGAWTRVKLLYRK
jgi:hypothetical protein